MQLHRRQLLRLAASAAALSAGLHSAAAQTFPAHPITMVVPVSAGGAMDTLARIVAQGMAASLGQPVIVENVTGASGSIGVGRVARAAPDGYTLVYGAFATHVVSGATMTLPYDVLGDFAPVALISATPWLIAVKKDLPVERSQRTHCLAQGQSGQGFARHRGRRQPVAYRGHAVCRISPVRAFSSCLIAAPRRPRRTWSRARSTCRSSIRSPACRSFAPAASRCSP